MKKRGFCFFKRGIAGSVLLGIISVMLLIPLKSYSQIEFKKSGNRAPHVVSDKPFISKGKAGDCAAPTNFKADKIYVKDVHLSWDSPEELFGIYDGFESHQDFAINSAGDLGWSYLDIDNGYTYSISNYVYPGRGSKMAYQVLSPWQIPDFINPRGTPHTGDKYLASFASENAPNNDWLVSPELNFTEDFNLTFFAASFDEKYGMERIKVGYSTTDMSPSNFTFVQGGNYIEVPDIIKTNLEWTKYNFDIPANAKYVAINCVSNDAFVLMIDDIYISTNEIIPMKSTNNYVVGFNVYRNGVKLNNYLIKDLNLVDVVPDYGIYTYSIEAIYTDGCISEKVDLKDLLVPSIHSLPFYDDFSSGSITTNFWELDPSDYNGWNIDYIVGDTVQPLISFSGPQFKNYTHSIVSKELDAKSLNNVWLRYDMMYDGFNKITIEKLDVEVFDGTNWIVVKSYNNQGSAVDGDIPNQRYYLDISNIVAGKMFKVRFRAHGADAYSVMYWFVDNIKVWNMIDSSIAGRVSSGGNVMSGVEVILYSAEGDILKSVTDANGDYKFENIEAMPYKLRVYKEGFNNWGLDINPNAGENIYNIALTAPILNLPNGLNINETIKAEEIKSQSITMQNSGNGGLNWSAELVYNDVEKGKPTWEISKTFTTSDLLQQSVGFDGEYFYSSSAVIHLGGMFWKYDKEGRFIESFQIKDIKTTMNLAYDGMYFYAASGKNYIHVLDLKNKVLVKNITVSGDVEVKHLCYDPNTDSFWGGSYNTIVNIGKDGKLLKAIRNVDVSCTGSAFDPYNENGPSVWLFDQKTAVPGYGNNFDLTTIRRYDLTTNKLTSEFHSAVDLPNFPHGTPQTVTYGTGLFGTTELFEGRFTLIGIISHDPSLIFAYDMYKVPSWMSISANNGIIGVGESTNIDLTFDGLELKSGDTKNAKIRISTSPNIGKTIVDVALTVNDKADYARPSELVSNVIDDKAVVLNWKASDGKNVPTTYNVYCNGSIINSVSSLTFTHDNLKSGDYTYYVTAVYAGGEESRKSNEVKSTINMGIPCYYPYSLKAENIANKDIKLTWLDPNSGGMTPTTIRWDNGINDDGIGLGTGGSIRLAAKWTANELTDYRQMRIGSVSFFAYDQGDFTICIYENEELVYSQVVNGTIIGNNTVVLDEAIYVDNTKDLMVGYDVEHEKGRIPIGIDAGPAVDGKGNMIYFDDMGWRSFLVEVGMNVNFNIAVNLEPRVAKADDNLSILGYNVYRNGNKINSELVSELEYEDKNVGIGTYSYNVTAQYEICESNFSNNATAEIFTINSHDAPSNLSANVVLNRNINLSWDYPINSSKGEYHKFSFVDTFQTKDAGEQAIVTDDRFIYTSYWQSPGVFNKYTMEGVFVEQFMISGVMGIRDLTFDGEFFYGGAVTPKLYKLDFEKRIKIEEITVPYEVRHCTFIPDLDGGAGGFEIGNWEESLFITKMGAIIKKGGIVKSVFGSAFHDGKVYYFCQTGKSKCEIHEYDLATNLPTGNVVDLSTYPQYKFSMSASAGGICTVKYENGSIALLTNIQDSQRNRVVAIELEGNKLIKGFNVYKDGIKKNNEMLYNRAFNDYESVAGTYNYTVEAIYIDNILSQKSDPLAVTIVPSDVCDKPINLKGFAEKRDIVLSWENSEVVENRDDVENYKSFSIESNDNWTMVDVDKKRTKMIPEITFENAGAVCAFMVFDFMKTTPLINNIAYSNDKVFASFSPLDKSKSNDWLISKKLSFTDEFEFSFMARGIDPTILESFKVAYSTTGDKPSDFIVLTTKEIQVLNEWEYFSFSIPSTAKYVAINAVSKDGLALLIDDITIGNIESEIYGYNIYRNGVKLNSELLKTPSYKDFGVGNGTFKYKVNAMYNTSCLSDFSDEIAVVMDYSLPCYSPTNLSGKKVSKGIQLDWKAPLFDQSYNLSYATSETVDVLGVPNGGIYGIAAKWEVADLRRYYDYSIYEVGMFFGDIPNTIILAIYQDDKLEYYQEVTADKLGEYNNFVLDKPFKVDITKNLLIGFHVEVDEDMFPFGIDAGPAAVDKGDLWTLDGGLTWESVGSKGNWALKATLEIREDVLTSKANKKLGYNIYRDDMQINRELVNTTTYLDDSGDGGKFIYKVAAVYSECGEIFSNGLSMNVTGIEDLENNKISVYPNPSKNSQFTIKSEEWEEGDIVDAFSFTGRNVYSQTISNHKLMSISNGELHINCGNLSDGVYAIRVTKNNKVYSVKLIIKK